MKKPLFALITLRALAVGGIAQRNFRISSVGAGGIRIGMTVGQARSSLGACRFKRTSDGEGVALVGVTCKGKEIMTLYSGERLVENRVDYKSVVEFIEIWDSRFKTDAGVRVGMLVSDVEKRLGKVKEIIMSPIESREYVTFARHPRDIGFRIYGGIYAPLSASTQKYEKGTRLHSIFINR